MQLRIFIILLCLPLPALGGHARSFEENIPEEVAQTSVPVIPISDGQQEGHTLTNDEVADLLKDPSKIPGILWDQGEKIGSLRQALDTSTTDDERKKLRKSFDTAVHNYLSLQSEMERRGLSAGKLGASEAEREWLRETVAALLMKPGPNEKQSGNTPLIEYMKSARRAAAAATLQELLGDGWQKEVRALASAPESEQARSVYARISARVADAKSLEVALNHYAGEDLGSRLAAKGLSRESGQQLQQPRGTVPQSGMDSPGATDSRLRQQLSSVQMWLHRMQQARVSKPPRQQGKPPEVAATTASSGESKKSDSSTERTGSTVSLDVMTIPKAPKQLNSLSDNPASSGTASVTVPPPPLAPEGGNNAANRLLIQVSRSNMSH